MILSLSVATTDLFARGGGGGGGGGRGGGGGFSGGSRGGTWGSSASKGSSWGTSASKPSSGSTGGTGSFWGTKSSTSKTDNTGITSSSTSRSAAASNTDTALGSKVNRSSDASAGRAMAVQKFESDLGNQQKYTTVFKTEPVYRPAYVPMGYTDPFLHTYHYVYFNPMYSGYGYWDAMGNWAMYNAVHQAAVSQAYSPGLGATLWTIFILLGIIIVVIIIVNRA